MIGVLPSDGRGINYVEYSSLDIQSLESYKNGNSYQKDMFLFMDMLEKTHPAFSPGLTSPFNIDSIRREGYKRAATRGSTVSLNSYLQAIAALQPNVDSKAIYPIYCFIKTANGYI
jgi:hypothetical protein